MGELIDDLLKLSRVTQHIISREPVEISVLGITVIAYAPDAILCWVTFIILAIWGYAGIFMHKHEEAEEEKECNQ